MRYALIIAGGSGTRLWPMSRAERPKQLLGLLSGRSLLGESVRRLAGLVAPARRLICTAERYRAAIRADLPGIGDEQIIGEPEGRDTLAAVGLPAAILQRRDAQATIAVFTADHLITPLDRFRAAVKRGFEVAESDRPTLVTFGITPTHPATSFGYLRPGAALGGQKGVRSVEEFREKPDAATARRYIRQGCLWNSGMFVWRAATLLEQIARRQPAVHEALTRIAAAWDTPRRRRVLNKVYPTITKISVDYAIMEPAAMDREMTVAAVPMNVDWLDVGSWPAYAQIARPVPGKGASGNRAGAKTIALLETRNCLLVSDESEHLIATLGVENLIIVHTPDATLIAHRDHAEQIKTLHQLVARRYGKRYV